MVLLSVNVNKVATIRNSRGGTYPNVLDAVETCWKAGAKGITVHPRHDERHIRRTDVYELSNYLKPLRESVEFNIEGDPRPDFLELVLDAKPHQCTLVPVRPGEITSEAGWVPGSDEAMLSEVIPEIQAAGIRVSVFVDPTKQAIDLASNVGADRIELYTEPYARAFERGIEEAKVSFEIYEKAAKYAQQKGLGINAGHDLDLDNLPLFSKLSGLNEVSIGHALISKALFDGLEHVVTSYLEVLRAK